jgi:DNA-binding NarL/FixJ family response regulator
VRAAASSSARGRPSSRAQIATTARPLSAILARAIADLAGTSTSTSVDVSATTGDLSSREVEVLRLLVAGRTNREIAKSLFSNPRAASKHVGNIPGKLGVGSRGDDGVFAICHAFV